MNNNKKKKKQLNIMVLSDEPQGLVAQAAQKQGKLCGVANNVASALKLLACPTHPPDVVIAEVNNELDCQVLKKLSNLLPSTLMVSNNNADAKHWAVQASVLEPINGYVHKEHLMSEAGQKYFEASLGVVKSLSTSFAQKLKQGAAQAKKPNHLPKKKNTESVQKEWKL